MTRSLPKPMGPLALLLLALCLPASARGQSGADEWREVLYEVLPAAQRFSDKGGTPPVFTGYGRGESGREVIVGYAFLTSDFPPEEPGYNGPIVVMVGMDTGGELTGARVVRYRESLQESRGDFLRRRGFQEQFAGKRYTDPFRVRRDVDGISGATITVGAMARGMRNAVRRVASGKLAGATRVGAGPLELSDLDRLQWPDLVTAGRVQRLSVLDADMIAIDMSLFYLWEEAVGRKAFGAEAWGRALEKAGERIGRDHLVLVGVDGPLAALFRPSAMRIVQDGDTLKLVSDDVVMLGEPRDGMIDGEFRNSGLMMVDSAVDMDRPFTIVADLRPGLGLFTTEYPGRRPPVVAAAPAPEPEPEEVPADDTAEAAAVDSAEAALAEAADSAAPEPAVAPATPAADATPAVAAQEIPFDLEFDDAEEETILGRTLAQTSWGRVGLLVALLVLVSVAFARKVAWLRWATLAATVAFLGFGGGGFLSVSHIISGIKVGPSVYLNDLPLLLLVGFTVVTTLLWGRVFCGFLCPFGAIQDFLERVVPKGLRRELPRVLHERASLVKYGVLGLVLLPALLGSDLIVFHYFEPFGTVFFLSPSVLLWTIALGLLTASAVVPRFYCRYVCPLGASLALASLVSPFRIRRVEQCTLCTVCERSCPTGAITAERVDFKECVRCNVCETKLIEKAGVCRHDMEEIRPRLVTLKRSRERGLADVA